MFGKQVQKRILGRDSLLLNELSDQNMAMLSLRHGAAIYGDLHENANSFVGCFA